VEVVKLVVRLLLRTDRLRMAEAVLSHAIPHTDALGPADRARAWAVRAEVAHYRATRGATPEPPASPVAGGGGRPGRRSGIATAFSRGAAREPAPAKVLTPRALAAADPAGAAAGASGPSDAPSDKAPAVPTRSVSHDLDRPLALLSLDQPPPTSTTSGSDSAAPAPRPLGPPSGGGRTTAPPRLARFAPSPLVATVSATARHLRTVSDQLGLSTPAAPPSPVVDGPGVRSADDGVSAPQAYRRAQRAYEATGDRLRAARCQLAAATAALDPLLRQWLAAARSAGSTLVLSEAPAAPIAVSVCPGPMAVRFSLVRRHEDANPPFRQGLGVRGCAYGRVPASRT